VKSDQPTSQVKTILLLGLVYLLLAYLIDDKYYQLILTVVPIWAMMGIAWNVFSGYSGLVSFGHAAFFGIGAYTVALAMIYWNLSPWLGIPLGTLAGVVPKRTRWLTPLEERTTDRSCICSVKRKNMYRLNSGSVTFCSLPRRTF
jgi:hypothetical protein